MGNLQQSRSIGSVPPIKPNLSSALRPILVVLCVGAFVAGIAALPNTTRRVAAKTQDKSKNVPSVQEVTPKATALDDDQDGDADIPARMRGRIDKQTYLRLRDQHISILRGIDEDAKTVDPQWRAASLRQMEQQERLNSPAISGTTWTEIGPFNLPNGQTQQSAVTTPVNGRVTDVAVDPTDSNTIYIAGAQGGVWRTTNGGTTWTSIFDTAQSLAIGALALAPSNPSILYVGTGEPNNSADSFFGVGVYRIDNADTTADLVGPINPDFTFNNGAGNITTTCFGGRGISAIVVHPTDPATIFVATAASVSGIGSNALSNTVPPLGLRGVYRSSNATAAAASVTFVKLLVTNQASLDVPGTGNTSIFDLALEPGTPDNLLVAVSGAAAPGGGVFRSTNALAATPTFTGTLLPGFTGLTPRLAINKVGAVVTVYVSSNEAPAAAALCGTNSGRLRKSTDGGVTWSAPLAAAEGYCGGQCSYDNPIGVDPNDANIVYLGGNARGTCSDVLKRSSNGGTNFTRDDTGLHADAHAIAFDPLTTPTTVWFGNDGGIWKRQDAAAGTAWLSQNQGTLGMLQFQSLAVHPTDRFFTIGGTQDNGTEAQTLSTGNWISAEGGDGGFALIDQSATDTANVTMYHTFFNQTNSFIGFDRTNLGACLAVKNSWEFRGGGFANDPTPACDGTAFTLNNGISTADTVLFYAPMALGPGTPNTLYFGTNKLYRSIDKGDTMTAVSQVLVAGVAVSAIGISPQNDNVRIAGLVNGTVFSTTTGANPLVNTAFPTPTNATASATNRFISRAVIDPTNSNTAYVTLAYYTNPSTAGQIWRTTNLNLGAAATWTSIGNTGTGLPNVPFNAFAIDANDPTHPGVSVLYAGSDIGVFRSTDSGASWTAFGTGLPRSAVFDMAIQPTFRILRVATHGRGMWEIALPGSPTAAKLSSFTANATDDGRVLIQWRTGAEVDNLGFNVYRDVDGVRTRITPQLVAGSALLAGADIKLSAGNAYAWSDSPPAGKQVRYLLEDIDLKGKSAWNGPIAVGPSIGSGTRAAQQQAKLLTQLGLRQAQLSNGVGSGPTERAAKPTATSAFPQAGGAAVKLSVHREGLYRVTQPDLLAAGLDSKVDPRLLQLFVDGREIRIAVQGQQDGRFDPGDSVGFYGVGLDAASSDRRVYWLVAGSQPGQRIEKVQAKGSPTIAASFTYTVERKDRTIYFSALRNGDAENFFGPVIAREPVDQSLTLLHVNKLATSNAQVEVTLQGVTQQLHQVTVLLNGADIGALNFGGQGKGFVTIAVPHSTLNEGENVVRLIAKAGETDVSLVQSVRISYQHSYIAESNALRLSLSGGQQVTIDGFTTGDIRVFDVTNPDALQEVATVVKAQKGAFAVTATAPGAGQRTLLALTDARAREVVSAKANQPSNWRQPANGANLLIITHHDFASSIAPLKSLRQSQGLSVAVVDVEDVLDEFSYGNKTPQGMRDFLAYAKGVWKKPPQYVLLVGDASLDPKNYLGYGDSDFVPTRLIDTQFLETVSDNWLTDFDGDGTEDLATGRLPVRSPQEAVAMINKIVAYDSAAPTESMLLVADRNDGFTFDASNEILRSLIPADLRVEAIDRNTLDDATARTQLLAAINHGQKIVNYMGHGSVGNWRGQLLTNDDALALTNGDGLSLFIMMTCLNGYYQDPVLDGLAESLMKARGGAMAVWASSGMTAPGDQLGLNQQMYRTVFDPTLRLTMGEATMRAKAAVNDPDIRRTWMLFGDPSMRLK